MNWARGLFRLWIVLSVLWIAVVALLEGKPDLEGLAGRVQRTDLAVVDIVARENADGTYTMEADGRSFIVDTSGVKPADVTVWRRILQDVALRFNEDGKVANSALDEARRTTWISLLGLAVAPPVLILLMGTSLLWALRGFRRSAT